MGSGWLGMGSYFGKMTPRAPGRFLDTSRATGRPYKIQKKQYKHINNINTTITTNTRNHNNEKIKRKTTYAYTIIEKKTYKI